MKRADFFVGGYQMIEIHNLTICHRYDLRKIVDNLTLIVKPTDKIAIIGEEGNGKSTLLKCIKNSQLIESYCEVHGEIRSKNERIGYLPQELEQKHVEKTVYEYFCESDAFLLATPSQLHDIAQALGNDVEMYYQTQIMSTLSGGEKIKYQLAAILLEQPSILLLDEPSNDLDISTLAWLENFIKESKIPIIYISHDETLLANTANCIVHLELVKRKTEARHTIIHIGYDAYKELRDKQFEKQMMDAQSERRQDKLRMEKYQQVYERVQHELRVVSRQAPQTAANLKKKMRSVKAMGKRFERERENMTEIPLREDAIFFHFEVQPFASDKQILDYHLDDLITTDESMLLANNIELQVFGNQKVCIIGDNGCGKTTLLHKIHESLTEREDIRIGYMPQNYNEILYMYDSPIDFLTTVGDKEDITRIRQYLGSMKFTSDEMEHSLTELSGGQRAKVFMLKMHLEGANVLLLDEPTRNFSPLSAPVVREELKNFGGAIIAVSHDRKFIQEVFDDIYLLNSTGLHRDTIETK